jgi:hypothetical protein
MTVKYSPGVKFLFARHVGNQIVDTVNVAHEFNFLSHYPVTRSDRAGRPRVYFNIKCLPDAPRAFNY